MSATPKTFFTRNSVLTVLLLLGLLVEANLLARRFLVGRVDLTEDREYTIAEASRRLVEGLQDRLVVTAYFTPRDKVPGHFVPAWRRIADLLEEYRAYSRGRLFVEFIDPAEQTEARADAERMGVRAFPVTALEREKVSQQAIYMGLVLRYQERNRTIPVIRPGEVASIEYQITTAIKSLVAEKNPRIAFFSREPEKPPKMKGFELPTPPERIFQALRDALAERVEVLDVKLKKDLVPKDVDVLVCPRPKEVSAHERFAIDQYLMRGGRLLVLLDRAEYPGAENFRRKEIQTGLDDLLEHWGIRAPNALVFENAQACAAMPRRSVIKIGAGQLPVTQAIPYPFWAVASDQWEGFSKENPATARLSEAVFLWASPVEAIPDRLAASGLTSEWLVRSSPRSWRTEKVDQTLPDERTLGSLELELVKQEPSRTTIALSISGSFSSFFEGKEAPAPEKERPTDKDPESRPAPDVLTKSPETRVVVVGDADFAADYALGRQPGQSKNFLFLANLIDWLALDPDLIAIRSRGARDRGLAGLRERRERTFEELGVRPGAAITREELQGKQEKVEEELQRFKDRIKYAHLVGLPLLVVLFGVARTFLQAREKRAYLQRYAAAPAKGTAPAAQPAAGRTA
ncbi:MAG TPA: GldG family protein [Planctomycetota bacterium]|nr:GldG family protein [Planctomycetota bacterium]